MLILREAWRVLLEGDKMCTYNEMSIDRIISTLKELKQEVRSRKPSKYFFALGHAIRQIEESKRNQIEPDTSNTGIPESVDND